MIEEEIAGASSRADRYLTPGRYALEHLAVTIPASSGTPASTPTPANSPRTVHANRVIGAVKPPRPGKPMSAPKQPKPSPKPSRKGT